MGGWGLGCASGDASIPWLWHPWYAPSINWSQTSFSWVVLVTFNMPASDCNWQLLNLPADGEDEVVGGDLWGGVLVVQYSFQCQLSVQAHFDRASGDKMNLAEQP